ncbi:MAG: hypothetical protein HOH55_05045 [Candidatus Marinimicrobia bacterium]|nr:hypothetical protein [Candidatus Neomarinimicrobiota bacterium]
MALLDSKQLNPKFTGSFSLSGSSQSLVSEQVVAGIPYTGAVGTDTWAHESASFTVLLGNKKGMMLPSGSSDPTGMTTDSKGMMFYNNSDGIVKIYDGITWIPAGDINTKNTHLSMSADINDDGANSTILFRIDGETDSNVKFRLKSDNEHEMTGSFNLSDNLTLGGRVLGDMRVTGDIIAETYIVSSSVTYLTQSFASGSHIFGDTLDDRHEFTGSLSVTGSAVISGSTLKVNTPLTSSTAIFTNNTQVGYPTSNTWDNGLSGSYFQNFDNTTHISEILRFMSGILSHSLDVSDAAPNNLYYNSIDTLENSLGSTDSINGYLPTNYTSVSNTTLNYLVHKGWTSVGATVFSGISVYHDNGRTHYVDFDSNSAGSSQASSSADSELFGLGSLSSGNANTFGIRIVATQSFSDVSTNTSPDESSNKFTTQSYYDETLTSFGTTNGVELAKINTANPAVIPAAYQDGKFENVGGTSTMSGSLSRKWHATSGSITSVSSSGYYKFHDLAVGIKSGSQSVYDFKSGTDKNRFWAPIDQIDSDIGTNSLNDTGTTHKALTATSRSLSGVPYLLDATFEVSTKITGLFNPMYPSSTTLVDMTAGSVGVGSVSISGDTISTNGGTVQTSGKVFQSDGSTAVNSGVPRYDDIAIVTASVSYDSGTSDSIQQSSTLTDTTFTVATKARNRNSSQSTLDTQTINYHTAGDFGQTSASGSLGIYGRAQGYDSNTLQDTTETFTGEDFRIKLADNVQTFSGAAWTTSYQLTGGGNQLGDYDLQVKPGFLVDPGGTYRYWYPSSFGSGTYKYYIRRFQTPGSTYSSMTINLNNTTLIAWNATTNGISCAILFESSGNGSGNNASLGVARIYDPVKTTSNLIEADISADNFKNPFSTAISLYGNSGGSIASGTYTVPIRNADGMYLDSSDNELYVIVRYKGDPTPIDDITLTFS